MTAKEIVDFPAVYAYLNQSSTKTVIESDTWNEDKFYRIDRFTLNVKNRF